ncbi:MAG: CoA-binding protein [Candidatus Sulfotelmatobacter sp.]
MATQHVSLDTVQDFLSHKRIAMAGVSRNPASFSVKLFEELCRRGYDVVPVNPHIAEVQGRRCFARVQDIEPPVEGVLLMTSPEATESVVHDCAEANIRRVWMYRATGKGAVSEKAVAVCRGRGIQVVAGECPFMFLPHAAGIHRFHGFINKIIGHYRRRSAA